MTNKVDASTQKFKNKNATVKISTVINSKEIQRGEEAVEILQWTKYIETSTMAGLLK